MKFEDKMQNIPQTNTATMREHIKAGTVHLNYQGLLLVLAEVLDRAASGKDTYCIIGLTSRRDAVLLTVTEGTAKARAGGNTLLSVSTEAERLL